MALTDPLAAGLAAGYGIAIPVGAVAVLIIETGARRGFRLGAAAGLGAASADLAYASLAAAFGSGVAQLLAPVASPLRWASVAVLLAIAARGLRGALRPSGPERPVGSASGRSASRTYATFLGITLLNPMTVAYFGALVLGLPAIRGGPGERATFALAAGAASASWQLLLAAFGALLHRHASTRIREATSLAGNLVIVGFAALIARDLLLG